MKESHVVIESRTLRPSSAPVGRLQWNAGIRHARLGLRCASSKPHITEPADSFTCRVAPAAPVLPSAARHACGGRGPATRCRAHPQHHARPSPHTPTLSPGCGRFAPQPVASPAGVPASNRHPRTWRHPAGGACVAVPALRAIALRASTSPARPAFRLVGPVRLRLTSAACAGRPPPA